MLKIVHYINQFYAGIGGEDKADIGPAKLAELAAVSKAFNAAFKGEAEVIATVYCGDSYFAEKTESALADICELIKAENPDMVIAGPAFNAGRYGFAAGNVAAVVKETLGVPTLTGMYEENPGTDYKSRTIIVPTKNNASGMRDAVAKMAPLALKLAKGEELAPYYVDGYMYTGVRKNLFEAERGAKRAVDMMVKKLNGQPFVTEFPMPNFDRVAPNPAVADLAHATVALCTSGGIVPKGNPDHIESSSASHYGEYSLDGVEFLTAETHQTAHGGYDPVYANANPNRVLPVDVMRDLEKEGKIGKLHNKFYTTVGNGTAVANAKKFAAEYAQKLVADGVNAVIMTST